MANIEKVQEKDLSEIQKLIHEEFAYTITLLKPIEERIKRENYFFFKILENPKILGFIELRIKHGMGEILGIAIKKEFRRKGYAKQLINFALKFLEEQNCFAVKLLVGKNNIPALKLYISIGFKTIRTIEHKKAKEEAYEMMIDLIEPITPQIM
ncbi:MAG: N-acetyltransferase [archaeon]|nr:N-acetyltransferase [archaeon]